MLLSLFLLLLLLLLCDIIKREEGAKRGEASSRTNDGWRRENYRGLRIVEEENGAQVLKSLLLPHVNGATSELSLSLSPSAAGFSRGRLFSSVVYLR